MIRALQRFVSPLARTAQMGAGPVTVNLSDDTTAHQQVQVEGLADETLEDVPHLQTYGLASRAKAGAQGLLLSVMGVRAQGVVLNVGDHRYRLKGLQEGEVALYDDQGQVVKIGRDGVEITTSKKVTVVAEDQVKVTAPTIILDSDDIRLGGEDAELAVALDGDSTAGGTVHASSTKVKAL